MRTFLNSTSAGNWFNGKSTLQGAVQTKTLYTRIQHYGQGANNYAGNPSLYETTEDKIFLLSIEEIGYTGVDNTTVMSSATTDTAAIRTNGSKVIFADQNARRFTSIPSPSYGSWLRSPYAANVNNWTTINNPDGYISNDSGASIGYNYAVFSHRPAAWVVQP